MLNESDFGVRDKKGYWRPFRKVFPQPLYIAPFKPIKFFKWIFGWNGYLFPWKIIWLLIAMICWFYLTPSLSQIKHWRQTHTPTYEQTERFVVRQLKLVS